jgi:integrase
MTLMARPREAEMYRLGAVLDDIDKKRGSTPWVTAAVRLLLLTGARLSEILTLKWTFVDLEGGRLNLPESKTGKKTVHLSLEANMPLANIPRLTNNPHVKPWRRIRSMAELGDMRLHDLRHSYASVAAVSGLSLQMIGKLLGHTQSQTTARYAHLSADPVKQAANLIGSAIGRRLGGNDVEKSS